MPKSIREIKTRLDRPSPTRKDDLIQFNSSVENLSLLSYIAYAYGHSILNLDQVTRARSLRFAMDFHNVVRKHDSELADFLDHAADSFRQQKKQWESLK